MAPRKPPQGTEPGVIIGGYELVRRIGRGGMAEVWVARKALGRKGSKYVAIKMIADHHVGDERYARMFRSEAELAAVLSHANIVQVFDEGEDDGRSYLVMEWVDGLNLLKLGDMLALLDDEQRRFRVISYIIGQLLHALHYAHSITSHDGSPLGVVHRDVSPQNVLVSNHGEVKLTDFGVAYYNIEESSGIHVKGKVRYMSPEQLSGQTRAPTVDLYAVGALLHELLDGKKFRGEFDDGQDLFSVVLSGQVSAMSRYVPPELDRLRLALLEPDPTRRVQSAEQALELLKRFPGYGDARDELTKLCGGLTGVLRPRVGPGQSGLVAAADQATTRWGGRSPLAKPKVEGAEWPAPAKAPPKRGGPPQPTGSITGVKGSSEASPQPAIITGQTEFIDPKALPGVAAASRAPTLPLQRSGVHGPGPAAPPSQPPASHGAAPAYVSEQPSSPLGAPPFSQVPPSGAPPYVPAQGSHPIAVQPAAAWSGPGGGGIPPTQRLAHSEISGTGAPPTNTELLDASMIEIIEIPSGSGTDRDIMPAGRLGEGTDTQRELRGAIAGRTGSNNAVPQRSAVALIGVGLVMVAAMSVTITWYLFAPAHAEVPPTSSVASVDGKPERPRPIPDAEQGSQGAGAAAERTPAQPEPEPTPAAEARAPDRGDGSNAAADPPTPPTAEPAPESPAGPGPADDPRAPTEDLQIEGEEQEPAAAPEPGVEAPKAAPKAMPKAVVKIFNNTVSTKAQVRLGTQTFLASDKHEHKLAPGKRSIKWRKSPTDPWKDSGSWYFKSGKRFNVYVTQTGVSVRISA